MERGVLGDGCTGSNGLEAGGPADAWAGARLCELGKGPCGQRGWGGWWTQAEDAEGCSEGDERDSKSGEDWNGRAG